MTKKESIHTILRFLDVAYVDTLPAQEKRAIDDCRISMYDIKSLANNIPQTVLVDLYDKIIWNWVWRGGPVTNSDWGITHDGMPLPLTVINPLETARFKYTYAGVIVSPDNASIVEDTIFIKECSNILRLLQEHYDVVATIITLETSIFVRSELLGTFIESVRKLENIVGEKRGVNIYNG